MNYEYNEAAIPIAEDLIKKYHPHLAKIKIAYVFKGDEEDKVPVPSKSGKAVTYAKAGLVPEKYQLLATEAFDFMIEFSRPIWDKLTLEHQVALVDHELTHCRFNDQDGPYLADHDIEEFRSVLVRQGFYRESIRLFIEAAQPLFDQPGVQLQLASPVGRAVPIQYGEIVRIVETSDMWTFDKDLQEWIKI